MQQAVRISQWPEMMPRLYEGQRAYTRQNADETIERSVFPTLHIHMLGTCWLASDGTPVTGLEMPRLQSLLAYLVLHAGVPHSRKHLASLLWPDSSEPQAHTNLRNLIYKLRQALPDVERWLVADRNTLMWCEDDAWILDALDFERAVARAEQAAEEGDDSTLRLALEQAVELYRGELLSGCYDEWILLMRERLSEMFLNMLECLLHLRERKGDFAGAIRVAQRLLREDPLHEASYRHLMRLYATSGNRVAVIRTYQNCVELFKRELAVEPTLKTRQVYEWLIESEKFTSLSTLKHSGNDLETSYALHFGQRYV